MEEAIRKELTDILNKYYGNMYVLSFDIKFNTICANMRPPISTFEMNLKGVINE